MNSSAVDEWYKAVTFGELELFEKSIDWLDKALAINPDNVDALIYKGVKYKLTRQLRTI